MYLTVILYHQIPASPDQWLIPTGYFLAEMSVKRPENFQLSLSKKENPDQSIPKTFDLTLKIEALLQIYTAIVISFPKSN